MEFRCLPLLFSVSLILMTAHAALPPQVYWERMLPTTPMPKAIIDLLKIGSKEIQSYDEFFSYVDGAKKSQLQDEFPFYIDGDKKTQSQDQLFFYADGAKTHQSQDELPFYVDGDKKTQSQDQFFFYADGAKQSQSQDEFPFYVDVAKKTHSQNQFPFYVDGAKKAQSQDQFFFYVNGAKKSQSQDKFPFYVDVAKKTHSQNQFPFYVDGAKKAQSQDQFFFYVNGAKKSQSQDKFPFYVDGDKKSQLQDQFFFYADGAKKSHSQDEFPFYVDGTKKTQSQDQFPFYVNGAKKTRSQDQIFFYADGAKKSQSQDEFPFYGTKTRSQDEFPLYGDKEIQSQDEFPLYGAKNSQSSNDANALLPKMIPVAHHHQHDNPKADLVFFEEGLRPGTKLDAHFYRRKYATPLLPRQIAERIPFSSEKIKEILEILSMKPKSENVEIVKKAISRCESPVMNGEEKHCATSVESMVDFITSKLGKNVHVISTEMEKETKSAKFSVKDGVKMLAEDNVIACHPLNYPYVVFFCHRVLNTTAHFMPLEGEDGTRIKAVALCHKDTSEWNPKHISFQMLQIKPGTAPVCHIFPEGHLLWFAK